MTALTQWIYTQKVGDGHGPLYIDVPMAAATTLYEGAMVSLNAAGNAVPAGTAGAGPVRGVATSTFRNTGSAAAASARLACGQHYFANSAIDPVTSLFSLAYAADDQTACSTPGGNKSLAGVVTNISDELGVCVLIAPEVNAVASSPTIQRVSGTLVAGVLVVDAGITVTTASRVVGITRSQLGGTFSGGGFEALTADMVAGGPGTGSVTIRALATAGTANTADTSTISFLIID